MAARIVEGLFTCLKRWELEEKLLEMGHKWPRNSVRNRAPLSAAECVIRILCWLDLRGDPLGRLHGVPPAEIERAAHWTGTPGTLVIALVATHWIDEDADGMRWHGYGSLNRLTLSDRNKKRAKRGDKTTGKEGTGQGTDRGTKGGRPSPSPGSPQKEIPGLRGGSGLEAPPAAEVRIEPKPLTDAFFEMTPEQRAANLSRITAEREAEKTRRASRTGSTRR